MKANGYKYLFWLSPFIGAVVQTTVFITFMLIASNEPNAAEPKAFFVTGIGQFLVLVWMIVSSYAYLLLVRYFSRLFWLLTCLWLIIISILPVFIAIEVFAKSTLWFKILLPFGEVLLFGVPVFIASYLYVSKNR